MQGTGSLKLPKTPFFSTAIHMPAPQIGDNAPDFSAIAVGGPYGDGTEIQLSSLWNQPVVLYFYPKDDTPGCTTQACGIRDSWGDLSKRAHIFGVSIDSTKSHQKFIQKFNLPFPLLSDPDQTIVQAYGVWVEKSMYGKTYMGTERSTFIIGTNGKITALFKKVKPAEHVDLLLGALA
jgi:peroxiredoxin Q/BCP